TSGQSERGPIQARYQLVRSGRFIARATVQGEPAEDRQNPPPACDPGFHAASRNPSGFLRHGLQTSATSPTMMSDLRGLTWTLRRDTVLGSSAACRASSSASI